MQGIDVCTLNPTFHATGMVADAVDVTVRVPGAFFLACVCLCVYTHVSFDGSVRPTHVCCGLTSNSM